MTASLVNFITINKNRGDLLRPEAFQTINEMILGMYKENHYQSVKANYALFVDHVVNYDDPHKTAQYFNTHVIIQSVYDVYTDMIVNPLSFEDFLVQIYGTNSYIELIRRIVLNRYIYNKVKNTDGSVPTSKTIYLSRDYTTTPGNVTLTFPSGINNESDFVRLSTGVNSSPISVIRSAEDLNPTLPNLPLIYSLSSSNADYRAIPYDVVFNTSLGLILSISLSGIPGSDTTIARLLRYRSPLNDYLDVIMTSGGNINLVRNGDLVLNSNISCSDGKFVISLQPRGVLTILTSSGGILSTKNLASYYEQNAIMSALRISTNPENLFIPNFGIRNLTLHKGSVDPSELKYFLV